MPAPSVCNVRAFGVLCVARLPTPFMLGLPQAGVHSGDSACVVPTQTIPESCLQVRRPLSAHLDAQREPVKYVRNSSERSAVY